MHMNVLTNTIKNNNNQQHIQKLCKTDQDWLFSAWGQK